MKQLLENYMSKATTRDVREEPLASALSRLAFEANYLLNTSRHNWIKQRAKELSSFGNWAAYAMETHITYAFERASMQTNNAAVCMAGSSTDIDIVWRHPNGVQLRMECVSVREPAKFWTSKTEVAPGLEVQTAFHDISGEASCLRVVQDKIRLKTIDRNGCPIKFPTPDSQAVHVVVADVSNAAGWDPDWHDLQEIALGRASAFPCWQHSLIGLFESHNELGTPFDAEFERSRYVRERIHAIIYLIDESGFHHSLNAAYCGHCVLNPNIHLSEEQQTAADSIAPPFNTLVTRGWLKEPNIS